MSITEKNPQKGRWKAQGDGRIVMRQPGEVAIPEVHTWYKWQSLCGNLAIICPFLGPRGQNLGPQQKELRKLDSIQQNTTKMIKELKKEIHDNRLHTPAIFLLTQEAEGRTRHHFPLKEGMRNFLSEPHVLGLVFSVLCTSSPLTYGNSSEQAVVISMLSSGERGVCGGLGTCFRNTVDA